MYFEHDPAIWNTFPTLVPGVLLVEQVRPDIEISARLAPLFDRARARLAEVVESDLAEIQAWRRASARWG